MAEVDTSCKTDGLRPACRSTMFEVHSREYHRGEVTMWLGPTDAQVYWIAPQLWSLLEDSWAKICSHNPMADSEV